MMEREKVSKQPKKATYKRPLETIVQHQMPAENTLTYEEIPKMEPDKYKSTLLSIPDSVNRVLDQYIGELKAQNYAVWDPINKIDRKVSKSSWIVRLVEEELRRQGKIG